MKLTKEEIYSWATRNYVLYPDTLDHLKYLALKKIEYDMDTYIGQSDAEHTSYMYFKFLGVAMTVLENLDDEHQKLTLIHNADREEIRSLKIMIENQRRITLDTVALNDALRIEIQNLKNQMYLSKCRVQIMTEDDDGWLLSRGVK